MDDPDILQANDPHYTPIGRVASTWAFLEGIVDISIRELIGSDPPSVACLTAQFIGPAPRMNALLSLVRLRGGSKELVSELETFAGHFQGVGTERNRVVHDPLIQSKGRVYAARTSARRTLVYDFEPVTTDEMDKTADKIDALITEFLKLWGRIKSETTDRVSEALRQHAASRSDQSPPTESGKAG